MEKATLQPSTSKEGRISVPPPLEDDDNIDLTLNIKDEEAEIARLQLSASDTDGKPETSSDAAAFIPPAAEDERIAKIEFHCSACDMREMVHYFGKMPPFVYGLQFAEDTFVMRDPFQPPPPRWKPKAEYFIVLGANCVRCEHCVCRDAACSFYYTSTFCLRCAEKNLQSFPLEVQSKLRKQLSAKQ